MVNGHNLGMNPKMQKGLKYLLKIIKTWIKSKNIESYLKMFLMHIYYLDS